MFLGKPSTFKAIDAPKPVVNKELNQKVSLFQGDITKLAIDVVVNAANNTLLGGSGGKIININIVIINCQLSLIFL